MRSPRIILLNDPTRGIDVGTKQEMYQLLRRLADGGAAIVFYSTDYDELIGCCDRVLVLYDGAVRRELVGAEITEHALIASALNISDGEAGAAAGDARVKDWRFWFAEQRGTLLALGIFVLMFVIYVVNHPAIEGQGFTTTSVANVANTAANKAMLLALVAMAQTLVVITAGIDLSVGMIFTLDQLRRLVDRCRRALAGGARTSSACSWSARSAARSTAPSSSSGGCSRSSRRSRPARSISASRLRSARFPAARSTRPSPISSPAERLRRRSRRA